MGVPKLPTLGFLQLWGPITLCADLRLRWGLKQSYSPQWELSNSMLHATCTEGDRVDSQLLIVGSQTANLISSISFGHNLCFKCPNKSCDLILYIYIPRTFRWYKELLNLLSFDLGNRLLKIQKSTGTPSPKVGVALGVWWFISSHFPTLPGACSVTFGLPFGPQPCKPLCFGHEPKVKVTTR
jgi:hypothetical protein